MERSVAIKKLGKLLGKNLGYRVDPKAPTKDEREAALAELPAADAARKAADERKQARFEAVLAADAEYQALKAASEAAREHASKLLSKSRHYKFTVGICSGMFFQVKAEGDSWEDILAQLTKKPEAVQ